MQTHANTDTKTLATLAILAVMTGVTGCAAQDPVPTEKDKTDDLALTAPSGPPESAPAPAGSASSADYLDNIARLKALRIFEVAPLENRIGETSNCYVSRTAIGVVCIQDVGKHAAEIATAERKLADFTELAERVAADVTRGSTFGPGTNLDAIKNLHLFEVGAFIVDQPESSSCYGFCNPSNQTREAQLEAIKSAL